MTHLIDISASFENHESVAGIETITAFFEAARTSDDEPLLEVLRCSVIPDLDPEYREPPDTYAVIRARSERFDAETIKPWLSRLLNDTKQGQPTLRSVDVVNASDSEDQDASVGS